MLCPAQNADLAVLFYVRHSSYEYNNPPVVTKTSSTTISIGIISAVQIRERGPHRLYVEFPYLLPRGFRTSVEGGRIKTGRQPWTISAGPRYQYALTDRWSIYAAAGAGAAGYSQTVTQSSPFSVVRSTEIRPTVSYGGGLDCRLTKLISLRGELRHFILLGNFPGSRNGFAPSFGAGIHF